MEDSSHKNSYPLSRTVVTRSGASVGIIGRGFAGLLTGIYLLKKNPTLEVSFLPEGRTGEDKASLAAIGVSTIRGLKEPESRTFAEKMAGHRSLPEFLDKLGLNHLVHPGLAECFADAADYKKSLERTYRRLFRGLFAVQRPEMLIINGKPHLQVKYPQDYWLDIPTYLASLRSKAEEMGGTFLDQTKASVKLVHRLGKGLQIIDSDEMQIRQFDHVVIAAGNHSVDFLNEFADLKNSLAENPGSTWEFTFNENDQADSGWVKGSKAMVLCGGQARVGSFLENESEAEVFKQASALFPHLHKKFRQATKLSGIRCRTRDRFPIAKMIWKNGGTSLWLNTGYDKSGLQLSSIYADRLTDTLCEFLRAI